MKTARSITKSLFRALGYEITKIKTVVPGSTSVQVTDHRASVQVTDHRDIIDRVTRYTMTSTERLLSLIDAVEYIISNNISGAFVECGVWKGGSAMAMMLSLMKHNKADRELFLYDTYEGMTLPTEVDVRWDGQPAITELQRNPTGTGIWCLAQIDEVRSAIQSTNYPTDLVHFVKGKVEETIPKVAPNMISLLRLDTDWYESTKHELVHLYPRLVSGGVLIIDDYGFWKGSRKAVDEYLQHLSPKPLLHRIDAESRLLIKP